VEGGGEGKGVALAPSAAIQRWIHLCWGKGRKKVKGEGTREPTKRGQRVAREREARKRELVVVRGEAAKQPEEVTSSNGQRSPGKKRKEKTS